MDTVISLVAAPVPHESLRLNASEGVLLLRGHSSALVKARAAQRLENVVVEQQSARRISTRQLERQRTQKREKMRKEKTWTGNGKEFGNVELVVLSPTASSIVELLRQQGDASKTKESLSSFSSDKLSWEDFISAVHHFWRYQDWSRVIQMCEWAIHCSSFKPDLTCYNLLIGAYGKASRIEEAEKVFKLMSDSEQEPDEETFSVLMNAYWVAGRVEKADALFERMQSMGYNPGILVCNIFLGVLDDAGRYKRAEEVFDAIGCDANIDTYNRMINVFGKARLPYKAEALFNSMRLKHGCPPDACTFAGLINAFARQGLCQKAENYFEEMQDFGYKPDQNAFSGLMEAYGRDGNPAASEEIFSLMQHAGVVLDTVSYNILINAYARAGLHRDAERIFKAMNRSGVSTNSKTKLLLLRAHVNAGEVSEVEKMVAAMEEGEVNLDKTSLRNALLEVYRVAGRDEDMKAIFSEMTKSKTCKPNAATYSTLIQASSEVSKAEALFRELQELGMQPDCDTWAALMSGYARKKLYRKCMSLLKKMVAVGCGPDASMVKIVLSSCRSPEQVEEATKMLNVLQGRENKN